MKGERFQGGSQICADKGYQRWSLVRKGGKGHERRKSRRPSETRGDLTKGSGDTDHRQKKGP